jgi:hypothetical protein
MTSACPIVQLEADARPLKPASHNKFLGTNGEGKISTRIFGINFISKGPPSKTAACRFQMNLQLVMAKPFPGRNLALSANSGVINPL